MTEPHRTPEPPSGPSGPSLGTELLEREETRLDPGDHERFAHYVRKDKIDASRATGRPVVALCGKVWVPARDPSRYPVCPVCKEIYSRMMRDGNFGDNGGQGGK
ncbi:MAG: DUF3039 domain-containing protein [Bifidobacteriaceae bacterium]|nr:DUF3039 domain-containing protein [Bifidobacteriaceae bacterium]